MYFTDPSKIPESFWRVSAKALIFDEQNRLLVCMTDENEWEIPGGGLEHAENIEQCIKRELAEEIKVGVTDIASVAFVYQGRTSKGFPKINIAVRVTIDTSPITPSDDDLVEARFVTKDEFKTLPFQPGESTIQDYIDQIWPS